jgi:hypothetical protein
MFDKLNDLLDELNASDKDLSKYKNAKDQRKILQQIKIEAQELRNKITKEHKNLK